MKMNGGDQSWTRVARLPLIMHVINRFGLCVDDRFMYYRNSYKRKNHLDMKKNDDWILFQSFQLLSRVHFLLLHSHQAFKFSFSNNRCLFGILSAVNKRMGSIGLVHIQDICMAHLFLIEEPQAEGQCICCVDNIDK
ncbi:hypothetical protein YC2023_009433 [Brassica napus]